MLVLIKSSFNFIAPFYDLITRFVFGSRLLDVQCYHLSQIQKKESVLVLGGGTGKILKFIRSEDITFLDFSEKMIHKASKVGNAIFIHADFFKHTFDRQFDWIICPFFLDCFHEENFEKALKKIKLSMKKNGKLIVTDFHGTSKKQLCFIKLMIIFFRLTTSLETDKLLPIRKLILNSAFLAIDLKLFSKGLFFSDIYRKKSTAGNHVILLISTVMTSFPFYKCIKLGDYLYL